MSMLMLMCHHHICFFFSQFFFGTNFPFLLLLHTLFHFLLLDCHEFFICESNPFSQPRYVQISVSLELTYLFPLCEMWVDDKIALLLCARDTYIVLQSRSSSVTIWRYCCCCCCYCCKSTPNQNGTCFRMYHIHTQNCAFYDNKFSPLPSSNG